MGCTGSKEFSNFPLAEPNTQSEKSSHNSSLLFSSVFHSLYLKHIRRKRCQMSNEMVDCCSRFPHPFSHNTSYALASVAAWPDNNSILQTTFISILPQDAMLSLPVRYYMDNHSLADRTLQIAEFVPIQPLTFQRNMNAIAHSQVNYRHYLIQDLADIYSMPFYWGVLNKAEAEAELSDKPMGSFLLRDSSHGDYVFTVSYNRFKCTLHARVEVCESPHGGLHCYTLYSHSSTLHQARTLLELLKFYEDENKTCFFEPLCYQPVTRPFPFSLQSLCRARIASCCTYDALSKLPLPKSLITYLQHYHYKVPIKTSTFA